MNAAPKFTREAGSGVRLLTNVAPSTRQVTSLADWAKTAKSKEEREAARKKRGISKQTTDRAKVALSAMIESGDYTAAKPIHVFLLYAMLHEHVYGVEASETTSASERKKALLFIGSALRQKFNSDAPAIVEFVRWVWNREASREQWRRTNGGQGGTIGCYLMFSARFMTDYCIARARSHAR